MYIYIFIQEDGARVVAVVEVRYARADAVDAVRRDVSEEREFLRIE